MPISSNPAARRTKARHHLPNGGAGILTTKIDLKHGSTEPERWKDIMFGRRKPPFQSLVLTSFAEISAKKAISYVS